MTIIKDFTNLKIFGESYDQKNTSSNFNISRYLRLIGESRLSLGQ